jgi:hypothetical protein
MGSAHHLCCTVQHTVGDWKLFPIRWPRSLSVRRQRKVFKLWIIPAELFGTVRSRTVLILISALGLAAALTNWALFQTHDFDLLFLWQGIPLVMTNSWLVINTWQSRDPDSPLNH